MSTFGEGCLEVTLGEVAVTAVAYPRGELGDLGPHFSKYGPRDLSKNAI